MEYGEGFRRMMFARRKRKGMTQTELGAEVGISQHGISDYECGKTSIPIDDAAAIAAVLEFSLDEATKLTKREGALYPSADEWELIDLFREIPEKNRREVIEIVRLTKKMVTIHSQPKPVKWKTKEIVFYLKANQRLSGRYDLSGCLMSYFL